MSPTNAVIIGNSNGEHIQLAAHRRDHEGVDDANWLVSEISLRVSGFRGRFDASLRSDDFAALRDALARLKAGMEDETWEPLEPWITLTLKRNDEDLTVEGTAMERVGYGNSLRFSFEIATSSLAMSLDQIDALLSAFPVLPET